MTEYPVHPYPKPLLKDAKRRVQNRFRDMFVYKSALGSLEPSHQDYEAILNISSERGSRIPLSLQSGI